MTPYKHTALRAVHIAVDVVNFGEVPLTYVTGLIPPVIASVDEPGENEEIISSSYCCSAWMVSRN